MDHPTLWRTEVADNISAVLFDFVSDLDDFKITNLGEAGDEVPRDVLADLLVRQGTCPEFLGVVSSESFSGEIA